MEVEEWASENRLESSSRQTGKASSPPSSRCKVRGRADCIVSVVLQEGTVLFCDEL